jgi:hypothetical protein
MGIAPQQIDGFLPAGCAVILCVFRIQIGNHAPGQSRDVFPGGNLPGKIDLNRVNARHMVNNHAGRAAVGQHPGSPLRFG